MAAPKLRFKEFDNDWINTKVKDLGEFSSGGTPSKDIHDYWNGNIPWISSSDLNEESIFDIRINRFISEDAIKNSATKKIPKNSILLVSRVGVGKVALTNQELCTSQDFTALTPKKDYALFIAYLMKNITPRLLDLNQGTSIKGFVREDLISLPISLPSKEEQTKIASFLSAVDEKISQLTQKHALLSQYKQGMMQKLFSQQIRFKADDGSEFGEWESRSLGEVGENIIGLTYSPTDVTNDGSGILVLRSSNIKNGRLDKSDQVRVNKKIKDKIIVQANDILICTRNGSQRLIGKSVIINDDEEMTFGAFMSVYRSEYNRFIAYLMQTPWFFEQVQMNLGARINQITTGTLNEFTFDFPCLEEQTKIANFLSAIDQKIEVVAEQIEQAKTWKKGLLQQMFV